MTTPGRAPSLWTKLPITPSAIIAGFLIAVATANVWPLLLLNLGVQLAAVIEAIFLTLFLWWARGGGPPSATQTARARAFRHGKLTAKQWLWGRSVLLCRASSCLHCFAFRFMPYPAAAFRQGYDLSFIPTQPLRWVAVVVSAASAGICEETGFRGFMQQPIEQHHGVSVAVFISSFFFLSLHLNKAWASPGMVPIVFWRRRIARPSRMVYRIAYSGHHRSFRDGRGAVRLLVDRYRWRFHRTPDHRNGNGSALPHHMFCVCDLACCRPARDMEAP
jgi:membrane protease YdiL (CAAX protease family)